MSFQERINQSYQKTREEIGDNPFMAILSWILLIGLLTAMIRIAIINIGPYYELFSRDNGGGWVNHIPIIGNIARTWNSTVAGISALLAWTVLQTLQVMWIIVGLDRKAHANALKEAQRFNFGAYTSTGSAAQSHDPYVRKMAKKARRIPFFFVRWSLLLGLISYTVDTVVGIRIYPPAESLSAFNRALSIGTLDGISLDNLMNLAIMLFSFELLAVPTIVVAQWVWTRSRD